MQDLQTTTLRKVRNGLIPFLGLLYFAAFIDRVNVGFAAEQMHRDLGFSAFVYGLGAGAMAFIQARSASIACDFCSASPRRGSSPALSIT